MSLNSLIAEYENTGKLKKFPVLVQIINYCFNERNKSIFEYFEKTIELTDAYLEFDDQPDESICECIAEIFVKAFQFIQNTEAISLFKKYFPLYGKYKKLIKHPVWKAKLLQCFGFFYWMEQDYSNSIKVLKESLKLINEFGCVTDIPNRYTNPGYIYESTGQYEIAEKYYQDALSFAKRNNSQQAIMMSFAALGRLNSCRDKHQQAILYFQEVLNLSTDDETENIFTVKFNLASSYQKIKDYKQAFYYFNQLKQQKIKELNPGFYYMILSNMANIYIESNQFQEAEHFLLETLQYSKDNDNKELMTGAYMNLSIIDFKNKKYTDAEIKITKALKLTGENQNKRTYFSSLQIYADILIKSGKTENALNNLLQCENYLIKEKYYHKLLKLYKNLIYCYGKQKDYHSAYKFSKKYINIKETTDIERNKKHAELNAGALYSTGENKHYLFKETSSLISQEMAQLIGYPVLGKSKTMEKVIYEALVAARNDKVNILLNGESGTGKELIAKLIHYNSNRKNEKFIPVNSALFNSGLIQSSLFGHIKGSFTGASYDQTGYFELVNKGTLFLDEIGDMPLDIQSAFLRVLEEKKFIPLGSSRYKTSDFRLISATHKDLKSMIKSNTFRLDFFNRINSLQINIPPLRDRQEDIPILVDYMLNEFCVNVGKKDIKISSAALKHLCEYSYPGNIRELNNIIQRLALFCINNIIQTDDVYTVIPEINNNSTLTDNALLNLNLIETEKLLIQRAMKAANNIQIEACKLLGISHYALHRKLKKYNLKL